MVPSRQQAGHQHRVPPLTLIPASLTSSSSPYLSLAIIILVINILTTVCINYVSCVTLSYTQNVTSSHVSSDPYAKAKLCNKSKDCQDYTKECVSGKCHCRPYFDYIPEQDYCAKSYGATCTYSKEGEELCNTEKFLSCDDTGTCSCHQNGDGVDLLFYDPYLETCVAPPGHRCELIGYMNVKQDCVSNAKCVQDPNRIVDKLFYGVCECSPGWVAKQDGCIPAIGSRCEFDSDCEQTGIECLEGECRCSKDRIYYKDQHECKVKVWGQCSENMNDCVNDAECLGERNDRSQYVCTCACKLGYQVITSNGTCERDRPGICKDSTVYDEYRERCSLLVGTDCREMERNLCVKHAFCGTGSKCQCYEGYEITGNKTCQQQKFDLDRNNYVVEELNTINKESSTIRIESANMASHHSEYTDCKNCNDRVPAKMHTTDSSKACGKTLFNPNSIMVLTAGVIVMATSLRLFTGF